MNRKVEILVHGKWLPVLMSGLEIDDVFRMFEPNGDPVNLGQMWIVINLPHWTGTTYMVDCEPIEEVYEY